MLKKLIILAILVLVGVPVFAQSVDTAWVKRYNGPGNAEDRAVAIAVDNLGNVYVAGYSTGSGTDVDYATIKYYSDGDTAWVRRYNGPGNVRDEARAITVDGSGNVYVTGLSYGGIATSYDYATIKYYPNGDTAWVRRYDGPLHYSDGAVAIAIDKNGNVYVTGYDGGGTNYATIKYYPNGDTAWVRRYDGGLPYSIAVDASGNVYVTGGDGLDYLSIKYYSNGDTAWVRKYNGSANNRDEASAIAVDNTGNVYVTGRSMGSGTAFDYATIKYYPNGDTAWVRRYSGPGNAHDCASAIAVDRFDNVYVTGTVSYDGVDQYATIKYYSNGDTAWVRKYNGPGGYGSYAAAIALDGAGNVYVTGSSAGSLTDRDYATIMYYLNGDTAWVRGYSGPGNSYDDARAIVVDGASNVYVTGNSGQSGYPDFNYDYATVKYLQNYSPNSFSLLFPPDSAIVPYVVTFDWGTAIDPDTGDQVRYDLYVSTSSTFHPDSTMICDSLFSTQYTDTLDIGRYYWKVRAFDKLSEVWSNQTWSFLSVMRGDANADKRVTVSDVIFIINYLFKDGPSPNPFPLEQGDVNCNGHITVSDVIYLINYLFKGGEPPCS